MDVSVVRELRRSFAISHVPYTYEFGGDLFVPFIMGQDDTEGDNISDRWTFSEARAHYWLWRNMKFADNEFVAINQYRRSFWFPQLIPKGHKFSRLNMDLSVEVDKPTALAGRPDYIEYVNLVGGADRTPLNEWLQGADLVVNRNLTFDQPVHKLYGANHRAQDWEIFAHVLRKNGYNDGRFNWLTTHTVYIFTPQLFNDYMTDWWRVMSEVYESVDLEHDNYQHRKLGFMSEWFMSMWLINLRVERPTVRVQTLPILEGMFQYDRQPGCM